jgi:hypothetical protein
MGSAGGHRFSELIPKRLKLVTSSSDRRRPQNFRRTLSAWETDRAVKI